MKIRLAYTAPGWLLCAATSVILVGNAHSQTTDSQGNPPKTLKTAVQRELDLLHARNKSSTSKTSTKSQAVAKPQNTTARSRTRQATTKPKKKVGLLRRWFGPKPPKPVQNTANAKPIQPASRQATANQANAKPTIRQTSNEVAQQPGRKSAIEIELEKLYRQDGRPMPPMNLRSAPNTNHPVPNFKPRPANSRAASNTSTSSARTQATKSPQPKRRTIGGFFQKLNPFRKKTQTPKTAPKNVAQTSSARRPQVDTQAQPTATKAQPTTRQPGRLPVVATKSVKSPSLPIPPIPQSPPKAVAQAGDSQAKPIQPAQATSTSDQFPNPFTEVSENEADKASITAATPTPAKPNATVAKPSKAEDNPFTGLKLDDPKAAVAKPAQKPAPATPTTVKVASPEPGKINKAASDAEIKPIAPNRLPPAKIVENPKSLPKTEKKPHADKIKRILARSGMKGLKGFCPVALRDERDLLDTNPKFSSTYGLKTYQFSSAAAKARFDQSPKKYAPAAEGFDVVKLAEDTQDVEGVLDNAVWYKDRLYLFATKANMQKFAASPATFSIDN